MEKSKIGFPSSTLKILAILFMVADHVAVALNPHLTLHGALLLPTSFATVSYCVLRAIGRLAFPIFTFFIAEGCRHTRSLPKYIARLSLFALISEIPCQLATTPGLSFQVVNIYVTLTLGAIACAGYTFFHKKFGKTAALASLIVCLAATYIIKPDYGLWGVMLIFAAFWFPEQKQRLWAYAAILFILYVVNPAWNGTGFSLPTRTELLIGIGLWGCSLLSLPLLAKYNGQRGSDKKMLFYVFYPAHLLMLSGLKWVLGLL